ncbi:MAG: T9SS type A sorting domain-containing protein [Prevotella sp.]|nr:T9SS type A sorting domain-containing protein [Prevotella sp.]
MRTSTNVFQKSMVVLMLFCMFSISALADGDFQLKANFDTSKTIDLDNFNSLGFQWEQSAGSYTYLQVSIDGTFKQSSYGEDGAWGIGWGTGGSCLTFYPYQLQGNLYSFPTKLFEKGIITLLYHKGMNISDGMEVDVWVRCGDFKDSYSFNEPLSVSNVLKMRVRLVYERINYPWYIVGIDFGSWSNNPKTIGKAALPLMNGRMYDYIFGEGQFCYSSGVFWLEAGHDFKIVRNLGSWTPSFCGDYEYIYRGDDDPDYGNMSVEETGWYEIVIYEKSEYRSTPSIRMELIDAPEFPNYTNVAINDIQMTPVASQKNLIWYAPVTFTEDTPVVFTANNGAITKIPGGNQTDTHGELFDLEWIGEYQHIIPAGEYVALFDVRGFYRFYDLQATASYRSDKGIPQPTDDYGTFEAKAAPIIEWSANNELVQVCEMPPLPAGATVTDWHILIGDDDNAVDYSINSDGTMSKYNLSGALGEYGHQVSASSNNSSSKAPASTLVSANARIYATYNEAGTEYLRLSNPFTITVDTRNLSSKPVDASSGFYLYDSWPPKKDKPFATDDNIHFTLEVPGNIGSFIILPGSTIDMEWYWLGTALAPPFAGTNMLSGVLYEKESLWAIEDGWNLPEFSEKDKTYTLTFNLEDMTYEFISPNTTSVKSHKLNDNKTIKDIYNLSGQRVSDNISSLPSGLYIINGRKMVKK